MSELPKMISAKVAQEEFQIYLDNLTHSERLEEIYSVKGKTQALLYKLASPDVTLEDFLPSSFQPHSPVIFHGFNSLPFFNKFQKRMCRSRDQQWIWGYNHQSMQCVTGPGYFVIGETTDRLGNLMIDYTKIPPEAVASWPPLQSNSAGIGALVYGNLKDYMRKISTHVFIGEATKQNKTIGYFILCREDH